MGQTEVFMKIANRMIILFAVIPLLYTMTACGGGGSGGGSSGTDPSVNNCNVLADSECGDESVCEYTTAGGTLCFDPIYLRGMVFDLANDAPIEGVLVVARDANGGVASTVAVTDADGAYELQVSVTRDEDGNPASGASVMLRADAADYQTFPGGVRQALPVDTTTPVDKALVVESSLTDIGLIALEAGAGTGTIFGTVEYPEDSKSALVVAELSATEGYTAIADSDGNYRIFNLPAGSYSVKAYVQGSNCDAGAATLAGGDEAEVNLSLNDDAAATLNGSVQIVNAPGDSATSVILVVESTFNAALVRGEMPPGLRAPSGGGTPSVTGSFTIEGIPAGTYVILAAFENDLLVRDPDSCIAGTAILHRTFAADEVVDLSDGFKITEALNVLSPGASTPELITDPTPTLTWEDDSSEDQYDIVVLDTFGTEIWNTTIAGSSGVDPSVTYAGPALESGMYYQFRATSSKSGCELSQTEDLKGVFYLE